MSDGNYNRNLLPYRDYQSGLRAGKAQTIVRANIALREILSSTTMDEEERIRLLEAFRAKMEQ